MSVVLAAVRRARNMDFVSIRLAGYHALSTAVYHFSAGLRLVLLSFRIALVLGFVFEVVQLR